MAILLLGTQVTSIITFFLSRNIRIARQRAWDQTVASRGKGPDFWQPYVEEWDVPPIVDEGFSSRVSSTMSIWAVGVVVRKGAYMRERAYGTSAKGIYDAFSCASSAVLVSIRRDARSSGFKSHWDGTAPPQTSESILSSSSHYPNSYRTVRPSSTSERKE